MTRASVAVRTCAYSNPSVAKVGDSASPKSLVAPPPTVPTAVRPPVFAIRWTMRVSRSPVSALPSGRNASDHGIWSPLASTVGECGTARAGAAVPSGRAAAPAARTPVLNKVRRLSSVIRSPPGHKQDRAESTRRAGVGSPWSGQEPDHPVVGDRGELRVVVAGREPDGPVRGRLHRPDPAVDALEERQDLGLIRGWPHDPDPVDALALQRPDVRVAAHGGDPRRGAGRRRAPGHVGVAERAVTVTTLDRRPAVVAAVEHPVHLVGRVLAELDGVHRAVLARGHRLDVAVAA